MRRGDVVTVADRSGQLTGKPRPALVVQSDLFAEPAPLTICPITSMEAGAPIFRIRLEPSTGLPLDHAFWIELDQLTTIRRSHASEPIGRVDAVDMARVVDAGVAVFLGLG